MIKPYNEIESKKAQVEIMFDNIAPKYDFLNHFLSLGIDKIWRKKVKKILKLKKPQIILDIATGTGDLAIELSKLKPVRIYGVDLSEQMLEKGRAKLVKRNLTEIIEFTKGDAENLSFEDNKFDAVTISFGARNFENLNKGIEEVLRVLKPGGELVLLEFSEPKKFLIKKVYNFYFSQILPYIGKVFSKDYRAYKYLPESVKSFPHRENFLSVLSSIGFADTKYFTLTFGISTIYCGTK